ncbi:MAG: AraC family transcriptional regulator [Rubrivivax sp.]|nr:AraC family transcriptional regulator [Rubrivivax sp.]
MSPRAGVPQVSARIGALVIDVASARGVELQRLMAEAGFDPAWLDDPEARMPLPVEEALWNRAAALSGDPLFGLHAAATVRPGAFDVLDYAVRTAPDLRSALQRLARYNRLVHDLASFALVEDGDRVRVEHRFEGGGLRPCRQASEFTLAALVVVARQISGAPLRLLAVEWAHAAPDGVADATAAYAAVFGVVPLFDRPVSCVTVRAADLQRAVPAADPGLARIVTAHAEQLLAARAPAGDTVAARVRQALAAEMANGPLTLARVAGALHLSTRSLQRRLDAEGTRFAELVDEVRRELALRYVADRRLALGEVAFLLGYAEPSPFHRAFRRWTGTTPAALRAAQR